MLHRSIQVLLQSDGECPVWVANATMIARKLDRLTPDLDRLFYRDLSVPGMRRSRADPSGRTGSPMSSNWVRARLEKVRDEWPRIARTSRRNRPWSSSRPWTSATIIAGCPVLGQLIASPNDFRVAFASAQSCRFSSRLSCGVCSSAALNAGPKAAASSWWKAVRSSRSPSTCLV